MKVCDFYLIESHITKVHVGLEGMIEIIGWKSGSLKLKWN